MGLLAALVGAAIVGGALLVVVGTRRVPERPPAPSRPPALASVARLLGLGEGLEAGKRRVLLVSIGVGVVVWLVSGWLLAVALAPAAALGLPPLLRKPSTTGTIDRLTALETWTRNLSGVLVVGTGLEQAIRASLASTPEVIRPEVARLVARLDAQQHIEPALRRWADEMNDATADLVAASLILGSRRRAGGIATALNELAASVAEQCRVRRSIEADRAGPRATARWVTLITLAISGALAFSGTYVEPYTTALGQSILALLVAAYAGALIWMRRIALGRPAPRFLPDSGQFTNTAVGSGARVRQP